MFTIKIIGITTIRYKVCNSNTSQQRVQKEVTKMKLLNLKQLRQTIGYIAVILLENLLILDSITIFATVTWLS